jgi:hypothetical protein
MPPQRLDVDLGPVGRRVGLQELDDFLDGGERSLTNLAGVPPVG